MILPNKYIEPFLLPSIGPLWLLLVFSGCGSDSNEKANAAGQACFDQGLLLIEEEDWESALDQFESVLTSGSVNADQVGELYAFQAIAFAKLGDFEESKIALENARLGADEGLIERITEQIEETKRQR